MPARKPKSTEPFTVISASEDDPPPATPGNMAGTGKYARHMAAAAVATGATDIDLVCEIGSPGKANYFRCPTYQGLYPNLPIYVDEHNGKKVQYLIDPDLTDLEELQDQISIKMMAPYVNTYKAAGVWMISIEQSDNPWISSALVAIARAQTEWVAAIPTKKGKGSFRLRPCLVDHGEPNFPVATVEQWIDLAFPPSRQICDRDHPVLKRLREGRE